MPTKTPNFNLNKLQSTDYVQDSLVTHLGQNADIIDAQLQNLQNQITNNAGLGSLALDIFATGFVVSGLTATKDGSILNQLDVAAGVTYLLQSDGSLKRVTPAYQTFTTSLSSVIYYLDLNPDGTYSWGTTHSAQNNYLTIAQVTTTSNGQINAVTDRRPLVPGQGAINAGWLNGNTSSSFAPASHMGAGGTAHATATQTTPGFISAIDKTSLDNLVAAVGTLSSLRTPQASDIISGINSLLFGYSVYKSNMDSNGIYTTVTYKRTDGTTYLVSTLSGGTSPNYTTMTWQFYNAAGTSIVLIHTCALTYDSNGNISQEVIS